MELKIDTKKDSVEDIRRIITFLQNFVNEKDSVVTNEPEVSPGAFNMFDQPTPKKDDDLKIVPVMDF